MESSAKGCPSDVELNNYYDMIAHGEPATQELLSLRSHVEKCPECRRRLETYSRIDGLIATSLRAPEGLAERILEGCRKTEQAGKDAQMPIYVIPGWRHFIGKAAAVVAVVGLLGATWYWGHSSNVGTGTDGQVVAVATDSEGASGVSSAVVGDVDQHLGVAVAQDVERSNRYMGRNHIVPVSTKGGNVFRGNRRVQVPHELSDVVRHVWTVDNLAECRAYLQGLDGVKVKFADNMQGKMIASIEGLDDYRLQSLVDTLQKRNWALVSPMLPQPNQPERVKFTKQPVTYTIWAVEKSN